MITETRQAVIAKEIYQDGQAKVAVRTDLSTSHCKCPRFSSVEQEHYWCVRERLGLVAEAPMRSQI